MRGVTASLLHHRGGGPGHQPLAGRGHVEVLLAVERKACSRIITFSILTRYVKDGGWVRKENSCATIIRWETTRATQRHHSTTLNAGVVPLLAAAESIP